MTDATPSDVPPIGGTGETELDLAHLRAGGSIVVGPFTVTAARTGGITLIKPDGRSSTFATAEEFRAYRAAAKLDRTPGDVTPSHDGRPA